MTEAKAVLVDSGSFRVDRKRALDKLMNFQLPDPCMYPLALVQAAVAGGATGVAVRTAFPYTELAFDGEPWTAEELKDPYECLFAGGPGSRSARNRNLAIGLLTALRLGPESIEVESVSGGERRTLTVDSPTEEKLRREPAPPGTPEGTVIRVHVSGFSREEGFLRRHCAWGCIPVSLDGKPLRPDRPEGEDAVSFDEDGVSGKLWLARPPAESSRIDLLTHGVSVCVEDPRLPTVQVEGWIRDDRFRKNISQMSVVKDERYRKAVSVAAAQARALMLKAIQRLSAMAPGVGAGIVADGFLRRHWVSRESSSVMNDLRGLFRRDDESRRKAEEVARASLLAEALRQACQRNRDELGEAERGALASLWDCPLIFDPAGRPLSLATLEAQRRVIGHVPFSGRWDPLPLRDGLAAWTPRDADKRFLDAMFPGQTWPVRTDWTRDSIDLPHIMDDAAKTLVRAPVPEHEAEVALCATFRAEGTRIRWLLEGRPPSVTLAKTGSLRLDIVADLPGRDKPPAEGEPELASLLEAALRKVPELYKVLLDGYLKDSKPDDSGMPAAAYYHRPKEGAAVRLDGPQRAAILEHLLDLAADVWKGGQLPPVDANDTLQRVPLFRTPAGGTVSLEDVRASCERGGRAILLSCSQPDDSRYLARERPDRVSAIFKGSGLPVEVVQVDLSKCRARKAKEDADAEDGAQACAGTAAPAPAPAPPKTGVSPEEWLAALRKCFSELLKEETIPAEFADLSAIALADRRNRLGGVVWRGRNGNWLLDPDHPAVKTLMSSPDLRAGLPYLASLVYSAVNRQRPELSDIEDARLQMALIARA